MAISASDVKRLRDQTGLGMMECKQALKESEGDVEAAVNLLREKGLAKMDSRTERTAVEGRIGAAVSEDRSSGVIVEVNSETDFTAASEPFERMLQSVAREALAQEPGEVCCGDGMQAAIDEVRLTTKDNVQFARGRLVGGAGCVVGAYVHFTGKVGALIELEAPDPGKIPESLVNDLCMHVAAVNPVPLAVNRDQIPEDRVDQERELARKQALDQGKPEQIVEKMVEGKIRKFYEDHALMEQAFIKDDKQTVGGLLPEGVAIRSFVRYTLGEAG